MKTSGWRSSSAYSQVVPDLGAQTPTARHWNISGERVTAQLANRLLAREPLLGTGTFDHRPDDGGPRPGWSFTRTSCCLFYRVPGGGLCGDCVLAAPRRR